MLGKRLTTTKDHSFKFVVHSMSFKKSNLTLKLVWTNEKPHQNKRRRLNPSKYNLFRIAYSQVSYSRWIKIYTFLFDLQKNKQRIWKPERKRKLPVNVKRLRIAEWDLREGAKLTLASQVDCEWQSLAPSSNKLEIWNYIHHRFLQCSSFRFLFIYLWPIFLVPFFFSIFNFGL